ncbi:hypothetical protein GOQ30_00060 [Flavobacterium sp. TP390]|uniref:Uncharacterized protein n=1 Tax=Flavobacterium profundi TaxID=1774945 RepID=A0A6I4IDR4_9FLAO|nr:hypothetical protein [Flavobacterium profundi]MVO07550.1 hypothetical protein [Flavobacterium profundi]
MKQYSINNRSLTLKVKKSSFVIRGLLFFLSFTSLLLPLTGMIFGVSSGKGFHIGYHRTVSIWIYGILSVACFIMEYIRRRNN